MQENWVEIEDYPNYVVSDHGRVMNIHRDHVLTARESSQGYLRVTLCNEGEQRQYYIHKLVANCFFGWSYQEHTIHYDGDIKNNHISNLRLRKRERASVEIRPLQGSEIHEFRRQWGKRVKIVETGEVFRTVRDCAAYINGDYSSIYGCLRGDRLSHRGFTYEYYDW